MLKLGGQEFARLLGGPVATETGVRVLLQLIQRDRYRFTMRHADAVIAADQRSQ